MLVQAQAVPEAQVAKVALAQALMAAQAVLAAQALLTQTATPEPLVLLGALAVVVVVAAPTSAEPTQAALVAQATKASSFSNTRHSFQSL